MDAHEDYVWPRATSELILLPVTGLECVGERLLAGEGPQRGGRRQAPRPPCWFGSRTLVARWGSGDGRSSR
uniref:Uncharacterized protein n=1 Tax=Sus scrofa TaxID=9823 RepID=A0A8D0WQK6_PIG